MLIAVDTHSGVPVFRQIMDQVKFQIASGIIHSGDELPTTRTLSAQLGVNPMTVSKAYSFLESEGIVERRPGKPLIVKPIRDKERETAKTEQLRQSLKPVITAVRQLGIDKKEAAKIFNEMLRNPEE